MQNLPQLPEKLYRFRPARSEFFSEELKQIRNNQLWMAPASHQNDKFEMRPSLSSAGHHRRKLKKFLQQIELVLNTGKPLQHRHLLPVSGLPKISEFQFDVNYNNGMWFATDALEKFTFANHACKIIKQNIAKIISNSPKEHLIASFCATPPNMYMWEHYANNGRGFAVEYSTMAIRQEENFVFQKVNYLDSTPSIDVLTLYKFSTLDRIKSATVFKHLSENGLALSESEGDEALSKLLLSKTRQWQNENEWRIIRVGQGRVDPNGGYFTASPLLPRRVIIGPNTSRETAETIKTTLGTLLPIMKYVDH